MNLKEAVKNKFQNVGEVKENFIHPLYIKISSSIIHTTFFMKDYEINSFYHLFFAERKTLTEEMLEEETKLLFKKREAFLSIPPDHYRSTVVLVVETEKFTGSKLPSKVKHLWFGIRGSLEFLTVVVNGRTILIDSKWKERVEWIFKGLEGWTLKSFT